MKTNVKTNKRIKVSVFCDQSIDAKIIEPSLVLPVYEAKLKTGATLPVNL